jgi:hypothetical protein
MGIQNTKPVIPIEYKSQTFISIYEQLNEVFHTSMQ